VSSHERSLLTKAALALFPVIFTVATSSNPCFGQGATAAINGTISDSSGAVIPEATVVLDNVATGIERSAVTNQAGQYVFPDVIPGTYTLKVSKEGFNTVRQTEFTLNVNENSTRDVTLALGATTQQVTVTATAAHLEAASAELGTVIGTSEVSNLPLNGRNFTQLLDLTPGVSPISTGQNGGGGGGFTGNAIGSFTFPSVNGQGNRSNMFLVDGFNNYGFVGNYAVKPIVDQIQEFKVQSHTDSAAYGGALGGIVNVATQGGTSHYHGDAWEFLRNNVLDARNTFIAQTVPYKQNQFGAVFGGPLLPARFRGGDPKTFFFIGYEGFRSSRAGEILTLNPTPQQLAGDLSTVAGQMYNPFSTAPDPAKPGQYTRQPFMCDAGGNALTPNSRGIQPVGTACNKIPAALIDQPLVNYVTAMLAKSPVQNTGITGVNFIDTTPTKTRDDTATVRFDHQFTNNTTGWVRYTGFTTPSTSGTGMPTELAANFVHGYQAGGAITHTFGGGTKVATFRFGRTSAQANVTTTYDGVSPTAWMQGGFTEAFAGNYPGGIVLNPGIGIVGYYGVNTPSFQKNHITDIYEGASDFTWSHGHHTIQAGIDINTNNNSQPINFVEEGFAPAQTQNLESTQNTGSGLASMLLGVPDNSNRRALLITTHNGWEDGFYGLDSWKATSKLDVNFGLRYDITFWPIMGGPPGSNNTYLGNTDLDTGQYILNAVPPACSATVQAPCIPGGALPAHVVVTTLGNHAILHNSYDNWQPRLGLAYRLGSNTVLRAAATRYYDNWAAIQQLATNYQGTWPSVGFVLANNLNYPTSASPTPTIPSSDPLSLGSGVYPSPTPFNQVNWMLDPYYKDAYSIQWNFGVQHSFNHGMMVEGNYVGAHDVRLDSGSYRNTAVTPGPGDPSLRYPFPYITPTFFDKSVGTGSYEAFQFSWRKTSSNGLTFLVSYTYSKTMNLGCDGFFGSGNASSGNEGCQIQDPYNLKRDWSVAGFDLTHNLAASWVYNLPFGSGQQYKSSSRVVNAVLGNWRFNGIGTLRSGVPYTVVASAQDIENVGGVTERANVIGPKYMANPTRDQFLNPASFVDPPPFTYGIQGRNTLRTPHVSNLDLSLSREFPFTESKRLEFRVDAFNAFNSQALGQPDAAVGDPNFGVVTSTAQTERQIQFALKLFW
jgi:outer membrane receptor protein involved in Fe transport